MKTLFAGALISTTLLMTGAADASTVVFSSGTVAASVSNVTVLGTDYEVTFVGDVSSADHLSAGFPFANQSEASAAATALAVALTAGGATAAFMMTPGGGSFNASIAATWYGDDGVDLLGEDVFYDGSSWITFSATFTLGTGEYPFTAVWTAYTPPPQVPLPASGLLIASALGGLALVRRRKASA